MKNALEMFGPDAVRLTIRGVTGVTFAFALHEPGLYFNKLEHMAIMDSHLVNQDGDKFIMGIWAEKAPDFNYQQSAIALIKDFAGCVETFADELEKVLIDFKLLGDGHEYDFDNRPAGMSMADPKIMEMIVTHTVSELVRRTFGIVVEGQEWAGGGMINQNGVFCPNHPPLGMGNCVVLQHPNGTGVRLVPRDDCNVAEGETSQVTEEHKDQGGLWFDVWFGDMPYRGLLTHKGHRLENVYSGDPEDALDFIMKAIKHYYPILFSGKDVVETFKNTFHFVDPAGKHAH